jgi:hypothetical protein
MLSDGGRDRPSHEADREYCCQDGDAAVKLDRHRAIDFLHGGER